MDPEYVDHEQATNEEVMEGFHEVVEKVGILLKVRSMEGTDLAAQWKARQRSIEMNPAAHRLWLDYPTYPDASDSNVQEFCVKVASQLAVYRGKKGMFARPWIMAAAKDMPAYMWWDQHGSSVPELQAVARIVLAQPSSSSICERINSEFEFVKDRRRNKLSHSKANKLVALFHNLRLLKRMKQPQYEEPAVGWSEDVDHSYVTKMQLGVPSDTSGLLKMC